MTDREGSVSTDSVEVVHVGSPSCSETHTVEKGRLGLLQPDRKGWSEDGPPRGSHSSDHPGTDGGPEPSRPVQVVGGPTGTSEIERDSPLLPSHPVIRSRSVMVRTFLCVPIDRIRGHTSIPEE